MQLPIAGVVNKNTKASALGWLLCVIGSKQSIHLGFFAHGADALSANVHTDPTITPHHFDALDIGSELAVCLTV